MMHDPRFSPEAMDKRREARLAAADRERKKKILAKFGK